MTEYAEIIVHSAYVPGYNQGGRYINTYEWKGSKNAPVLINYWDYEDDGNKFTWPLKLVSRNYASGQDTYIRTDANPLARFYYIAKEKIMHKTSVTKYRLLRTAVLWGLGKDNQ
jgi:hypothetical protein